MSPRTTVLSSIVCAFLLIMAGCSTSPTDSSSPTNTVTDTSTEISTTSTPTTEPTETNQRSSTAVGETSQTTTKGIFGSIEHELQVNNYLNSTESVRVEIESDNGTVVLDKNPQVDRNSSREFDFEFPHTGAYTVVVNTSFADETRTWNVTRRNPTVAMSVVLIDDELHVGLEAI